MSATMEDTDVVGVAEVILRVGAAVIGTRLDFFVVAAAAAAAAVSVVVVVAIRVTGGRAGFRLRDWFTLTPVFRTLDLLAPFAHFGGLFTTISSSSSFVSPLRRQM